MQHSISDSVAIGVIDSLEMVDVQQSERQWILLLLGIAEFSRQSFFKETTIVDTGQFIRDRPHLKGTQSLRIVDSHCQVSRDRGQKGSCLFTPLYRALATMKHDQACHL